MHLINVAHLSIKVYYQHPRYSHNRSHHSRCGCITLRRIMRLHLDPDSRQARSLRDWELKLIHNNYRGKGPTSLKHIYIIYYTLLHGYWPLGVAPSWAKELVAMTAWLSAQLGPPDAWAHDGVRQFISCCYIMISAHGNEIGIHHVYMGIQANMFRNPQFHQAWFTSIDLRDRLANWAAKLTPVSKVSQLHPCSGNEVIWESRDMAQDLSFWYYPNGAVYIYISMHQCFIQSFMWLYCHAY